MKRHHLSKKQKLRVIGMIKNGLSQHEVEIMETLQ